MPILELSWKPGRHVNIILLFLYLFLVTPSHCLGHLSMYLLGDWHGCAGHGWTINHFYLYQKIVWDYTTWQLMSLLLYPNYLSSIQEKRGWPGKLYLTSILSDCLHSTPAGHSSPGGYNPPSPGLTNDSKNRKSKGNSRARMAGIDRDQARHKAALAQNSQQDRVCYY